MNRTSEDPRRFDALCGLAIKPKPTLSTPQISATMQFTALFATLILAVCQVRAAAAVPSPSDLSLVPSSGDALSPTGLVALNTAPIDITKESKAAKSAEMSAALAPECHHGGCCLIIASSAVSRAGPTPSSAISYFSNRCGLTPFGM
ncbi:hypothetical protein B0H17DRAFT_1197306 [Mycena rosella]|uniref:Uncharacterized protein n=1 Tax=Mycena rosella TaxID=1033263 RepID=A0AAD7DRY2_MYCRO|nr:hypothetical protein B0H17DRAFT_1197306 [Mycena rosella]